MILSNPSIVKPITKIPDKLIYLRSINTAMKPAQEEFVIFSTKGEKGFGLMRCHKHSTQLRDDYNGKTLAIDYIMSTNSGKGFAKDLIKFAKNYSKQIGCNGHVVLKADPSFTPNKVPHLFYRKCGFTTLNKKLDKKMDKFIKQDKNATHKDFRSELMYFPPPKEEKTCTEQVMLFLRKIIGLNYG